jgi:hypothetical protein
MVKQFDVFLSHNSKDKPAVRQLAEVLKGRGLRVWLDEWELVPGRPWQEALEQIIQTANSAAVLVGKDGLGPWEIPEMRACLTQFVNRKLPVIPVLLPGTAAEPKLPLFLQAFTWVDLRQGLTDEGLYRLQWGITGVKPAQIPASPQTRSAFTEKARKEIDKLLSWPRLSELRKGLSQRQEASSGNPLDALIPLQPSFDVTNSIDVLHRVTESWLEQLHGQGANTREHIEDAKTLLGWLILLAVREEWLREKTDLRDRLLNAEHVAIPVETEVGTDVVVARLHECQAKPELDVQNSRVFNPHQINWTDWTTLEAGIVQQDRLMELRKLVWKKVMRHDPPANFGESEVQELKETLAIRYKRGDHYYIIISAQVSTSQNQQISENSGTRKRLKTKIKSLEEQWEVLNNEQSTLSQQLIRETRVEEKLRLKPVIADMQAQSDQLEQQLSDLENQLTRIDAEMNKFTGRNDNRVPAVDNILLRQLRQEFPHLFAFLIGTGSGEEVLVMPERRLVVLVREFLLMLRKYS